MSVHSIQYYHTFSNPMKSMFDKKTGVYDVLVEAAFAREDIKVYTTVHTMVSDVVNWYHEILCSFHVSSTSQYVSK